MINKVRDDIESILYTSLNKDTINFLFKSVEKELASNNYVTKNIVKDAICKRLRKIFNSYNPSRTVRNTLNGLCNISVYDDWVNNLSFGMEELAVLCKVDIAGDFFD